jgi:hypothetical protein
MRAAASAMDPRKTAAAHAASIAYGRQSAIRITTNMTNSPIGWATIFNPEAFLVDEANPRLAHLKRRRSKAATGSRTLPKLRTLTERRIAFVR